MDNIAGSAEAEAERWIRYLSANLPHSHSVSHSFSAAEFISKPIHISK